MPLTLDETTLYFYNLGHAGTDPEKFRLERFNRWLASYQETLQDNKGIVGTRYDSGSDLSFKEDEEGVRQLMAFQVSSSPKYGTSGHLVKATKHSDIKDGKAQKRKAHEVDKDNNNNTNDGYSGGRKNIKLKRPVADNPRPTFVEIMELWQAKVLPTLIHYVAGYKYPWGIDGEIVWRFLQPIIDHFIPNERCVIEVSETLLDIVMQRLDEWRSSFGSTALAVLNAYFKAEKLNTVEERRRFARGVLRHNDFLFFDPAQAQDGVFHGSFIQQTFAAHSKSVINAATHVPGLGESKRAIGALGLAAAAAEWALRLWKRSYLRVTESGDSIFIWQPDTFGGKMSTRAYGFNDNWSEQTWVYVDLARGLSDDQFNLIMAKAQCHLESNPPRHESAL